MNSQLLIIEDDEIYANVLKRSLDKRGYVAHCAHNLEQALVKAEQVAPDYAILDLNIKRESGLDLIEPLKSIHPKMKILILTGYASIKSAVIAVKLGAYDYLSKPASVDVIIYSLNSQATNSSKSLPNKFMSVQRMEWEYIQRVLIEHDGNITATARALTMHRRTLQRKLEKRPPVI
jgi:two-component system response regulator RegA